MVQRLIMPLCVYVAMAGCGGNTKSATSANGNRVTQAARTHAERGPVKVTVVLTPNPVHLSDEAKLVVSIDYEMGVEIEKPPFGDAVGGFLVREFHEPLPEFNGNRESIRQIYTLEPLVTGLAQIHPITIRFTDKRPNGDGKVHQVETEALSVNVLSVVKDMPSLALLKGFEGPRVIPEQRRVWPWILGGCIAFVAGIGCFWIWRMRRQDMSAVLPTPREQADSELEALRRSGADRDDVKRYYVELTGIVRRYIERTTKIQAPEQTTEEFLREIGQGTVFAPEERQNLKDFLEAADLVKFAAFRPMPNDIGEAYQRARKFVGLAREDTP